MLRKKQLDAAVLSAMARERMTKARLAMIMAQAFFGILALRLELLEDLSCETMWVDGVHLGYNPHYAMEISEMECKGVICHEVLHVANRHHLRRGWRNFEKWNRACDYAINLMVLDAGFMLPDGLLVDEKYRGMSAEMIYELLPDEGEDDNSSDKDQNQDGQDSDDDQKQGSSGQKGQDKADGKPTPADGDDGEGEGEGEGDGDGDGDSDSDSKSGSDSKKGKGGPVKGKKKAPGEVRDCPPDVDPDALTKKWQSAIAQAADAQMMRGNAPGNLVELMQGLRKPVINWVDVLWEFAEQCVASEDYHWRVPNRNYSGIGLYLPSLIGSRLPGFGFARDTSISVPKEMIEQAHAEINAIKDHLNPEIVYVIDADTQVAEVQELMADDELKLEVKGRGGTDLRAPYEWVEKNGVEIAFMIHMTDMDGPLPDKDPGYPVIFLTPPGAPKPPFGIQIEMQY